MAGQTANGFTDGHKTVPNSVSSPEKNQDEFQMEVQNSEEGLRQRKTLSIERPVFNQEELEEDYDGGPRKLKTIRQRLEHLREKTRCSGGCLKDTVLSTLPFINILKKYNLKTDLINDVIAGLTVGIMQIPQGMAYAVLASVDAVYGLYMSFFPIIVYFFFGTSRHVSLGTFAVISLMVGGAVDRICAEEENGETSDFPGRYDDNNVTNNGTHVIGMGCAMGVATALSFIGGLMQIAMGLLRLGFVVIYLSEPMTRGFTTAASLHVFSSQIKSVFGVNVPRYNGAFKLIYTYRDLFLVLPETNPAAVLATIISCAIIFVVKEYANPPFKKKFRAPIPIDLVIVIAATAISYYGKFEERYGLDVIGEIPTGIPAPELPPFSRLNSVVVDGLVIAIVSFAISIAMAELFAKRNNYKCDANQELLAHGITNLVCCNLHCYMMSVSMSRSLVQESVGGVTQIAGLVSSTLILVVLLALASLFEALPDCVLAAIIIIALKGMFMQVLDVPKLWRVSKTDASIWLITFLAVLILDIDIGLLIGVAWSFLTVVGRTHRPYCTLLGQVGDTDVYADIKAYDKAREITGVKIFRPDNSIYFANCEYLVERVYHKVGVNPKHLKQAQKKMDQMRRKEEMIMLQQVGEMEAKIAMDEKFPSPTSPVHHVIIDCSCMSFVDYMGVARIATIVTEYKAVDVHVFLAACKPGVMETLADSGFHDNIPRSSLFPTVHDAVLAALRDKPHQAEMLHINLGNEAGVPPAYDYKNPLPVTSSSETNGSVFIISETASKNDDKAQQMTGVDNMAYETDPDDTKDDEIFTHI